MGTRPDVLSLARRVEAAVAEHLERVGRSRPAGAGALGLGLWGEVEPEDLDRVEARLGRDGEPVRIELASPADGTVAAELGSRHYAVRGFRQVWVRDLGPAGEREGTPHPPSGQDGAGAIRVRGVERGEEPLWEEVLARAFLGTAATPTRLETASVAGATGTAPTGTSAAFLAVAGDETVGAALVTATDGVALLASAGVLPAHRGRGVHGALVAARLDWGRRRGCDLAAAVTVPGSPAEGSLERCGFRCAYPRAVMVGPRGRGLP